MDDIIWIYEKRYGLWLDPNATLLSYLVFNNLDVKSPGLGLPTHHVGQQGLTIWASHKPMVEPTSYIFSAPWRLHRAPTQLIHYYRSHVNMSCKQVANDSCKLAISAWLCALSTLHISFRRLTPNMWFSFNNSSNDMILEELEDEFMVIYTMMFICINVCEFLNPNELEEGGQGVVDHNHIVHGVFLHMRAIHEIWRPLQTSPKLSLMSFTY